MFFPILIFSTLPTTGKFMSSIEPVLKSREFEFSQRLPGPEGSLKLMYVRKADRHTFEIEAEQATSQDGLDDFLRNSSFGNAGVSPERSPSGVPLGDHSFVMIDSQKIIAAADGFVIVSSTFSHPKNSYSAGDERALEAESRVALAEMIGNTLKPSGSPLSAEVHTNQHPHLFYKPLSQLAKTTKVVPVVGEWFDHCTVQLGQHKLEFVLASDAVAIDGKWTFVEAFVARQNGVWMIPTKVLKQKGIL